MSRVLPALIIVMLMIYCVVEVAQSDPARVRLAPRWLWFAVIVLLPVVGSLGWLFLGRPRRDPQSRPPMRPRAPDDDPDFLRGL